MKRFLKKIIPKSVRHATYPVRERIARIPLNFRADWRAFWRIAVNDEILSDLLPFEKRVCSQNGEDGIISAIFTRIGATNKYFVEFGVEDGKVCNTRLLRRRGWNGLQMDPADDKDGFVKKEFITAENVESLFTKYEVPEEPDLLSLDIDGNDYWVWKAISRFSPRVIIIEYNATIPPQEPKTIKYDPEFRWDRTDYFGAGLGALVKLGRKKGYTLVGVNSNGVNAFFVRDDLIEGNFAPKPAEELFRPFGPPHTDPPHADGRNWETV